MESGRQVENPSHLSNMPCNRTGASKMKDEAPFSKGMLVWLLGIIAIVVLSGLGQCCYPR